MTKYLDFVPGSKFGGILDMITDRCATAGLLLILSHLYLACYDYSDGKGGEAFGLGGRGGYRSCVASL